MNVRDALPALEGKLDEATHHAKLLQQRQEDLILQQARLEKRLTDSDKRSSENEKKVADRLGWAEQQLVNQEQKSKADRDQTNRRSPRSRPGSINSGLTSSRSRRTFWMPSRKATSRCCKKWKAGSMNNRK